jgi:ATP-dependent Lon protease
MDLVDDTYIDAPADDDNVQSQRQDLAVADEVLPDIIPLVPINGRPYFPGQVQPIQINPEQWASTLEAISKAGNRLVGLCFIDGIEPEQAKTSDLARVGCVVRLHRLPQGGEQRGQFLAQGLKRFRIRQHLSDEAPLIARVAYPESHTRDDSDEVRAYAMALIKEIKELLPLNPLYSEELKHYLAHFSPNQPSLLADFSASLTTAKGTALQEVLETVELPSAWTRCSRCCAKSANWPSCRAKYRVRSMKK